MDQEKATELFKLLSDRSRLDIILCLNSKREVCANDILKFLSCKQATLSHHMGVLVDSGLVKVQRDGKYMFYKLNTELMKELFAFVSESVLVLEDETDDDFVRKPSDVKKEERARRREERLKQKQKQNSSSDWNTLLD